MEGDIDGDSDGASLCGRAPATTKSLAVAEAAFVIKDTSSWLMLLSELVVPSKLITAKPLTSYIPGTTSESTTVISCT